MDPDPSTTTEPPTNHLFPGTGPAAMIATMLLVVVFTAVAIGIVVSMI
ncbi:hypothetical protein AB0M22_23500 [Nocardia sp. NPDC051756]